MRIASYYIHNYIDSDTMQWQRKVIIFGGLNFKVKKLIYNILLVTGKFQLDCSIRIFDCSIRVYRCIVNAAWYLYRGLSPSLPTPSPGFADLE